MTSIVGTPVVVLVTLVGLIVALLVLLTRRVRAARAAPERRAGSSRRGSRTRMIWTARPDTTLDYLNATCMAAGAADPADTMR